MERNEIIKKLLIETISIDIKVGDVVLGGKFKNKRITVKDIGKNDKGEVTINGKPLMRFRLTDEKPLKEGLNDQSPESWFENILNNVEFNNGIFSSGIKTIMKYNSNTQTLLIDINTIYTTLKEKFGLNNDQITKLIRRAIVDRFELGGIIANVRLMS